MAGPRRVTLVEARNFASFRQIQIPLQALTVLVGPNGSGKSNVLKLFRFLGETARTDLAPAVERFGGMETLLFWGERENDRISIGIEARLTQYASARAPDEYQIRFRLVSSSRASYFDRNESFIFKKTKGAGRRITLAGRDVTVTGVNGTAIKVNRSASGLSLLRKLGKDYEGEQVEDLATLFDGLRVLDIDAASARRPSISKDEGNARLTSDARNLAGNLLWLCRHHTEQWSSLVEDMRRVLPGLQQIEFTEAGGAAQGIAVELHERGLRRSTPLAEASYGTVRALALFALLHDPYPPALTCLEEIDHGLHPDALDPLVDRLRAASARTQLVVATHSPALVNRLKPEELVVLERDTETGATRRPDLAPEVVRAMELQSGLGLGELWFSGLLGSAA